ncbi:hypothetical protein [Sphingobium estronivorans]|uniref:hypothetical protein n=1 Tax=Sphingobium estronivorans TaxID=1577690 RepID=UPI00123B87AE|nr:hypothetical protein [Sphingobium estronivorans]
MGVEIDAMDGGKLKVTGDLESLLHLPGRAVTDSFFFAFSDGTLIRGHHDIPTGRCHLTLATEGAALVRIMRTERHDCVVVDWKIEWMTLSCGSETLCPISVKSSDDES